MPLDIGQRAEEVYTRIAFWYELARYNPLHAKTALSYASALGTWLSSIGYSANLAIVENPQDLEQVKQALNWVQAGQKLIGKMEIGGAVLRSPDWAFTPERINTIAKMQSELPLDWLAVNCPNSGHYLAVAPAPMLDSLAEDALIAMYPPPSAPERPSEPELPLPEPPEPEPPPFIHSPSPARAWVGENAPKRRGRPKKAGQ